VKLPLHFLQRFRRSLGLLVVAPVSLWAAPGAAPIDLASTTIVIRSGALPPAEAMAARVLAEEIKSRTGLTWPISTTRPPEGVVIAIASGAATPAGMSAPAPRSGPAHPELQPEGFRLIIPAANEPGAAIWIRGADSRGALFGVGELLRRIHWASGAATVPAGLDLATAPAQPIRGHQLGYRATANSYDGWNDRQFEQYIRELALFGANSIEGIPFHDERESPHMPLPRDVMNRRLSEICAQYELEYWVWVPADFALTEQTRRAEFLRRHEALFRDCPRLDGIFFPGGDPGDNAPELVFPYLEEVSRLLAKSHPRAKIWLSMQGYEKPAVDYVHQWISEHQPDWLGGLVAGPSSPPIPETRARLPQRYGLRDYPDITHTVRCQWPTLWWDPAFARTEGRECSNPRPVFYKFIVQYFAPYTSGFISYSDGVHDDVNKAVWSRLGWQPETGARDILLDYTRCFFGAAVAEAAADGLLALEKNWDGALAENGGVAATLALWQRLEQRAPECRDNWRWQLCLLRAYYDAYIRERLLYETALEQQANQVLADAARHGADAAMQTALAILARATSAPVRGEWHTRITNLCADLFRTIRLQTSVPQYHASGAERGAILDHLDVPLNNRWWLEDEFARIRQLPTERERVRALEQVAAWEQPGPGSFYDAVGQVGKAPHVVRGERFQTDPTGAGDPPPGFWWWDSGFSRRRLTWQVSMDWPLGLKYHDLDPRATYRVRLTGYGQARIRGDGQLLPPLGATRYEIGEFLEFAVPQGLTTDGHLQLTFDQLPEEAGLNWRKQSRVSEVWLLKTP